MLLPPLTARHPAQLNPGHLLAVTSLLASHPPTDQPKNYTSSSKYMYDAFVYVYINNWSK